MKRRFFVTIRARNRSDLVELQKYEFDLFQATAELDKEQTAIQGLLTLEQIERLVVDGYKVLVEEESSKRSRAHEVTSLKQWLEAMGE